MLRGVLLEELNGDGKTTLIVSDIILQGGAQTEMEKKERVKNQPWPRFPLHANRSFRGIFHFLLANFV